ncbi:MAG: macro domain-containing protein [Pseudomonadota bacterium]|jgi:O-acetyl-ADP-ribose deacetylase (regulator of RNase III)
MIRYTTGNLLEADAEALVNTVNTVGVMGKGIALMFKETFPENFKAYALACEHGDVQLGEMFVTHRSDMYGPKWIINFPTKKHWRNPSKLEWIEDGLRNLRSVIERNKIRTIAIPPLGAGNGGLDWGLVKPRIEAALADLGDVDILVFEPTVKYQNVAKRVGVEKLTPSRALIAEIVRRYWVLGIECTLLEVQKLAYFIDITAKDLGLEDPLRLEFKANRYGPYADKLRHLLNSLDGSYLHCDKRIADAGPLDIIWFDETKRERLEVYFTSPEARAYKPALEATARIIDGFESPLGMELLATVEWLRRNGVEPTVSGMTAGIRTWPGGDKAAERKANIFDERLVSLALDRLTSQAPA